MTRTILAVAAVLAMGCAGGDPKAERTEYLYGQPEPDAATLDTSCPTPAAVTRPYTFDAVYLDQHATCPPDVASWWTYDPEPIMHCEWRCVSYACAAGQDVRIDFVGPRVVAIVSGPSAYCG
jgi:hypothetical protein